MIDVHLSPLKHCPACGEMDKRRRLFEMGQFDLIRCGCGHRFIDPCLHEDTMVEVYKTPENLRSFDPAHEHYYEYESLSDGSRTLKDYQEALKQLQLLGEKGELLEVGCGTGAFVQYAYQNGWQAMGLDSSDDNIQALTEKGVPGIAARFLDYETDKRFQVIVFWDLLEHISEPGLFLNKSRELLKPGGFVLIAGPLYPNLLSSIAESLCHLTQGRVRTPLERMYFLEHTSYFSSASLKGLLERSSFKVLKSWKSETDLKRYTFPGITGKLLPAAFMLARVLSAQNRILLIAQKKDEA